MTVRLDQLDMADAEGLRYVVQGLDRRVARPPLQRADVLLGEVGALGHLFLRQAASGAQAREVSPNQFAHVHARTNRRFRALSLSPIVCIQRFKANVGAIGMGAKLVMKRILGGMAAAYLSVCSSGPSFAFQTGEEFDAFQRKKSPTNTMACNVRWSDITGQPSQPGEEEMPFLFSYIEGELWFRGVNTGRPDIWGKGQRAIITAPVERLLEKFGGRFMADQLAERGGDPQRRTVVFDFVENAVVVFITLGETKSVDEGQVVHCERYSAP